MPKVGTICRSVAGIVVFVCLVGCRVLVTTDIPERNAALEEDRKTVINVLWAYAQSTGGPEVVPAFSSTHLPGWWYRYGGHKLKTDAVFSVPNKYVGMPFETAMKASDFIRIIPWKAK